EGCIVSNARRRLPVVVFRLESKISAAQDTSLAIIHVAIWKSRLPPSLCKAVYCSRPSPPQKKFLWEKYRVRHSVSLQFGIHRAVRRSGSRYRSFPSRSDVKECCRRRAAAARPRSRELKSLPTKVTKRKPHDGQISSDTRRGANAADGRRLTCTVLGGSERDVK